MDEISTTRIITNPDNGLIMIKNYNFSGVQQLISYEFVNSSVQPTELTPSLKNYFVAAVKD